MYGRSGSTLILILLLMVSLGQAAEPPKDEQKDDQKDQRVGRYLELGTQKGVMGGEQQMRYDREQIKAQILTFIPPLLRPAFTQHAFVLPPKAYSVGISHRYTKLNGNDFFVDHSPDRAVFGDFRAKRNITDFNFMYGFDLNRTYLHSFTVRVNIPYLSSDTNGSFHPNGQQFIGIDSSGSTSHIGDIGIFLKKKFLDQGTAPVGLAGVAAIFLPTGNDNASFGRNGLTTTSRPLPGDVTTAQGFDALMASNVASGVWGDPRCFFRNFNAAHREVCNGAAAGGGGAYGAPGADALSFAPGGANAGNLFVGDFPFNNGVFDGYGDDGRMPGILQSGTGSTSFLLGLFLTRQFSPNGWIGRSAAHLGVTRHFVSKHDGVDFGDTTKFFASYVRPVYKDFLAVDVSFVGIQRQRDKFDGQFAVPVIHSCDAADVANAVGGCSAQGDQAFVFDLLDRQAFVNGFTGLASSSLIFSPDPQIRLRLSGLVRVVKPDLGPGPPWIVRAGFDYIF